MREISVPAMLGETGVDMSKFPTHGNLISWAHVCARNDESAGEVLSRRTLKGAAWIKTLMTQATWAASRKKDSYLRAQYLRLCRTTGDRKKAIIAVAASMLTIAYYPGPVSARGCNRRARGTHAAECPDADAILPEHAQEDEHERDTVRCAAYGEDPIGKPLRQEDVGHGAAPCAQALRENRQGTRPARRRQDDALE